MYLSFMHNIAAYRKKINCIHLGPGVDLKKSLKYRKFGFLSILKKILKIGTILYNWTPADRM